jgi:hypothetical protein
LLLFIGVTTPIGYGVVDRLTNGDPRPSLSTGWVALVANLTLQKAGEQGELDSAWLFVDTLESPVVASRPTDTSYTVLLCGKGLVRVGLLLGGGAMLVDAKAPVVPVVSDPASPTRAQLFETQLEALPCNNGQTPFDPTVVSPTPAPDFFSGPANGEVGSAIAAGRVGVVLTYRGRAAQAITHHLQVGPWRGPHIWRSWPVIGRIPGTAQASVSSHLGTFTLDSGPGLVIDSRKNWVLVKETTILNAGPVHPKDAIDFARPDPGRQDQYQWRSDDAALGPIVRLTDSESLQRWSSLLTLMAVAVGVGGGILATIVISGLLALAEHEHLVRPRRRRRQKDVQKGPEPEAVA